MGGSLSKFSISNVVHGTSCAIINKISQCANTGGLAQWVRPLDCKK